MIALLNDELLAKTASTDQELKHFFAVLRRMHQSIDFKQYPDWKLYVGFDHLIEGKRRVVIESRIETYPDIFLAERNHEPDLWDMFERGAIVYCYAKVKH